MVHNSCFCHNIFHCGIWHRLSVLPANKWNKLYSLFSYSKAFLTLFGCSMWRSCLHPIQVLTGGVAWSRVSSKIPFFVPTFFTNQCHSHGAKKKGIEITIFSWSTNWAPAFPLSYDLIKRQGHKSIEFWRFTKTKWLIKSSFVSCAQCTKSFVSTSWTFVKSVLILLKPPFI
jgi:hypothetical protein